MKTLQKTLQGLFAAFLIMFMTQTVFAQSSAQNKILGTWLSEDKTGKIEIYKTANKYYGKLIWGKSMYEPDGKTSKKDIKNQDVSKRSRNLKDLQILTDFVYNKTIWEDGKVYDPYSGKTYSSTMQIKDDKLHIRGYIGISLIGRTNIWTRIN